MEKMNSFVDKDSLGRELFNEVKVSNGDKISLPEGKGLGDIWVESNEDAARSLKEEEQANDNTKDTWVVLFTVIDKIEKSINNIRDLIEKDSDDKDIIAEAESLSTSSAVALDLENRLGVINSNNLDDLIIDKLELDKLKPEDMDDKSETPSMTAFSKSSDRVSKPVETENESEKVESKPIEGETNSAPSNIKQDMVDNEKGNRASELSKPLLDREHSKELRQVARKILNPNTDLNLLRSKVAGLDLDTVSSEEVKTNIKSKFSSSEIKSGKDLNDILTLTALLKVKSLK